METPGGVLYRLTIQPNYACEGRFLPVDGTAV